MIRISSLFELQQTKRTYFPSLTGFRTVGAIFIFLHHFNPYKGTDSFMYNVFNELDFALPAFFALSGFLITLRYYDNFSFKRAWMLEYMQNRVARVYPLYIFLTVITFIPLFLHSEHIGKTIGIFFANITFLKGFSDSLKFTGIPQAWSLTVEECFYFAAPVIFYLCRKKIKMWQMAIALYITGALLVLTIGRLDISGFFATFKFTAIYTFFGRCVEFFAGVQMALLFKRNPNYTNAIFRKLSFTMVGWVGVCICSFIMYSIKGNETLGLFTPGGIFINNVILPFFVCCILWGLIKEDNWFSRLMRTRAFDYMGRSSYAFYLIHLGVWYTFFSTYVTSNLFVYFVFVQIMAVVLYLYIEEPMHTRVRNFKFKKLKPAFAGRQKATNNNLI